jgi:ferredoxin
MHRTIAVHPAGYTFTARPGQTVLQAALSAGMDMPNSCRNGTCRTCMARLRSGNISYQIEWPGVSAEEKAEGYFLPCVACAQSDLLLEQPLSQMDAP